MSAFRLVVEKGRSKGKVLRLKPTGEVVLGRDQKSSLVVQDPQASRRHLRISAKLGEFVLEDLGSSNGTFVNGQRVTRAVLRPGDKVLLGETLVWFLEESEAEAAGERKGELTGREVGGYRVGRLLGRGGMGTVYEAVQLSLERVVAFKVLAPELAADPGFVDRFVAEARAAGRLSHAHIVAVFDVGQEDELRYYSMELMPGGSLEDLLRKEGRLSPQRLIPVAFDAARGLEFAEKQGLIHRDIKPDNLMLSGDGTTKIIDLGIATWHAPGGGVEVSGSPLYIAPEHALGKPIDHRVDLYGLGISLYQLLCGEPPFQGSTPREIVLKHVHEPPQPLRERAPEVPPDLADLVMRLISKDPDGRPAGARQLQADLLELARRHGVDEPTLSRLEASAAPDLPAPRLLPLEAAAALADGDFGAAPPPGPRRSRRGLVLLGLLLGLVGLLAGGGLGVASQVEQARAARRQAFSGDLERARELSQRGLHEEAEALAGDLLARLEQDGRWPELAEQARDLAREEARARAENEEQVARTRLLAAERLERQYAAVLGDGGSAAVLGDGGSAAALAGAGLPAEQVATALERLEGVAGQLDQIQRDHPRTQAARAASELSTRIRTDLLRARQERDQQARTEVHARERLQRTHAAIERLLRDERRPDRFARALEHVRAYEQEFGPAGVKAARALQEDVLARARQAVDRALQRAGVAVQTSRWGEAREELLRVEGLGIGDLDARVGEMRDAVDAAERAARVEAEAQALQAEMSRVNAALAEVEALRAERRFAEAALRLETAGLVLDRAEAARRYQLLRQRLEGAGQALALLAREVRAGRPVRLRLASAGKGTYEVRPVEVDAAGRSFSYELAPNVLRDVQLSDPALTAGALLRAVSELIRTPGQRLQVACLAFELGLTEDGRALLLGLAPGDPELRQRAADLLSLADAE